MMDTKQHARLAVQLAEVEYEMEAACGIADMLRRGLISRGFSEDAATNSAAAFAPAIFMAMMADAGESDD